MAIYFTLPKMPPKNETQQKNTTTTRSITTAIFSSSLFYNGENFESHFHLNEQKNYPKLKSSTKKNQGKKSQKI